MVKNRESKYFPKLIKPTWSKAVYKGPKDVKIVKSNPKVSQKLGQKLLKLFENGQKASEVFEILDILLHACLEI